MNIPEILYSQFKIQKTGIIPEHVFTFGRHLITSANMVVEMFEVPPEFDFIMSNCAVSVAGGVGQFVVEILLSIHDLTGRDSFFAGNGYPGVNRTEWVNWSGSLWVPEGCIINVNGTASAGAITNKLDASLQGVLIPKLNV